MMVFVCFVLALIQAVPEMEHFPSSSDPFVFSEGPAYYPEWDCNDPLGISGVPQKFRRILRASDGIDSTSEFLNLGCLDIRKYPAIFDMGNAEHHDGVLPGVVCPSALPISEGHVCMPFSQLAADPFYRDDRLCFPYRIDYRTYIRDSSLKSGRLCFPKGVEDAQWHLGSSITGRVRLDRYVQYDKAPVYIAISEIKPRKDQEYDDIPVDSMCREFGICVNPYRDYENLLARYSEGRIHTPSFLFSAGYVNSNCSEFIGDGNLALYHVQLDLFQKVGPILGKQQRVTYGDPVSFCFGGELRPSSMNREKYTHSYINAPPSEKVSFIQLFEQTYIVPDLGKRNPNSPLKLENIGRNVYPLFHDSSFCFFIQSSLGSKTKNVRDNPSYESYTWNWSAKKHSELCVPISGGQKSVELPGYTYQLTVNKIGGIATVPVRKVKKK